VSGVPITKGTDAGGAFLGIGQNGTHHRTTTGSDGSTTRSKINDPRRPLTITLLLSSPGNAVLRQMQQRAKVAVRVVRKRNGEVILETDGWVEERSPHRLGLDEQLWELTVLA